MSDPASERAVDSLSGTSRGPERYLPVGHIRGLKLWSWTFFAFLYLPILVLIAYSFNESRLVLLWSGFSLDWYVKILDNDDIHRAAKNSLIVAVISTLVATAVATVSALVLARGGDFRGRAFSFVLISLPILVPEIVTAVAVLIFFANLGLNLGLGNVIIAHITFCIPFAYMPIRARLEGMDATLEQAAQDLYASDWEVFWYVTMPLLKPGILSGAMLSFVISMDDFIITLMVAGAGSTTLPVYIFSMIRQGITPEVNAVSTVFLAISVLVISLYWIISLRNK